MPVCKLCRQERELRESHHFPRFVIRWLKETGTGYLRQAVNPNERKQDGPKAKWLCEECEQRFSSRELYFAETIFRPYLDTGGPKLKYDERAFYFCLSILWRTVVKNLEMPECSSHRFYSKLLDAEEKWRMYLMGQSEDPGYRSVQLFLSDVASNETLPTKNFNMYLARALDATVGSSQTQCLIYTKFGRFLLFGHLTSFKQEEWINTQIHPKGGILEIPQEIHDDYCGDFLVSRAREGFSRFEKNVSSKSKAVIRRHIEKNIDKLMKSDSWRVQMQDAFKPIVPHDRPVGRKKVGRNDPCPCGSGMKYKKCHGA